LNALNHRFNNSSNEIIFTCNIFLSSSTDYFNFKSPYLLFYLNHYSHFKNDNLILQTEFLYAKKLKLINLINLNYLNKERDDGIHDLFFISKI
jgi:hypothetical protein